MSPVFCNDANDHDDAPDDVNDDDLHDTNIYDFTRGSKTDMSHCVIWAMNGMPRQHLQFFPFYLYM